MALIASLPSAGLFVHTGVEAPVPLLGVAVDVEITGVCARVSVAHRYVNREATPIEAVYVFPLDEGAAVCGFEAVVDGVVVVGQVHERERAFERYDTAIERGDGAFLLDEHRPDVFQASIGNLPPGRDVLVRVTYVTELAVDDGRLRFTLPTTIAPKYAPEEDRRGVGQPDAEALNPPVAWSVPYGLAVTVGLTMPGGITAIASPSHPVSIALTDGRAEVTLGSSHAALDRDFVLTVDAPALRVPCAWAECHGEHRAIAVGFVPAFEAVSEPVEIIFVVDRSGSMAGESIAEVRNALQLCLRSLVAGCSFNIVGFGTTYQPLFPESRAYSQESLDAATRYVELLHADLGGTELIPVLTFVLSQPARDGLPRRVVVLTDGEVTNTDMVIALVAMHRETARVFTFGIGSAASQHLVRGLARAGGGIAEFIHPGERIESRVMRQFARLLAPAMTDARLDWVGGEVTTAPAELAPVFAGQRLIAYGLVTGAMPTAARLTATLPSGVQSWEILIEGAPVPGASVTTLAARTRIRELEEGPHWTGQRGSRQRERKEPTVRQQIIDLAVRHGLMSRETSFVAVERRTVPVVGDLQLRRVPVMLAHGWAGSSLRARRAGVTMPPPPWWREFEACGDPIDWLEDGDDSGTATDAAAATSFVVQSPSEPLIRRMAARALAGYGRGARRPATLDALVALQAADGSWALSRDLARIVERDLAVLEARLPEAADQMRCAWATALAIVWLEVHASVWQDEWQLLSEKASLWLSRQPGAVGHPDWLELARGMLRTSA